MKTHISLLAALACLICFGCGEPQSSPPATTQTADIQGSPMAFQAPSPETPSTRHEISVHIQNFTGNTALLAYPYGKSKYILDTVEVKNGKFVFEGDEPLERGIYTIALPPENTFFEIIVDYDQEFSIKTDTGNYALKMEIEGSAQNELFYNDMMYLGEQGSRVQEIGKALESAQEGTKAHDDLVAERKQIDIDVKAKRKQLADDNPGLLYSKLIYAMMDIEIPDPPLNEDGSMVDSLFSWKYARAHYFDQIDFSDAGLTRTPVLYNKIMQYVDRYTVQFPDSIIVAIDQIIERSTVDYDMYKFCVVHLFNHFVEDKRMCFDKITVHMIEQYYMNEKLTDWVDSTARADYQERALATKATMCGEIAPDFSSFGLDNQPISMRSVQADYTILYFWDYDCGHCKKETPKLAETYKEYPHNKVALFTVSINGDVEEWKTRLENYGFTGGIHTQDHRRVSGFDRYYDILTTPRIFVLDKDKRILAKRIGAETLKEVLDHELGRK